MTNRSSASNEIGRFKLKNIPIGTHEVFIEHAGYERRILPAVVFADEKNVKVRVEMTEEQK